jgi:acetylornithine deacetylase/succinyl-diaminopimelate desuccinylase-like protein
VLFGPGDIRLAHFTDEYVPLAEVEIAAGALAETILAYCGQA